MVPKIPKLDVFNTTIGLLVQLPAKYVYFGCGDQNNYISLNIPVKILIRVYMHCLISE
jgi:hypothetical protein